MNTEQDYEQDYEPEDPHHTPEDTQIIEQKEPQEKLISLLRPTQQNQGENPADAEQKGKLISRLKGILHDKQDHSYARIEEVKLTKKAVAKCKQEIKTIGDEVDKEMNKSLLKHSKPYATVSIHSIFSAPKNSDPQVSNLKAELARVRAESKKLKAEIQVREHHLQTPVNLINQERASELKSKIKEIENELKKKTEEKEYLEYELKMIDNSDFAPELMPEEEVSQNRQKNVQVLMMIKEEKSALYELDKEDRACTQKIRYLEDLESNITIKKNKQPSVDPAEKEETQNAMRELVQEINQTLEKRNKAENDRKNIYKNLSNQASSIEAKNWEIINKLREIDAWLLKHYSNNKNKKIKARKQIWTEQETPKQQRKENQSTKAISQTCKNDKNIVQDDESEIVMTEKKKNYQFFIAGDSNSIILTDEMLGNRQQINAITFVLDEQYLYGLWADYLNEGKKTIQGYKIVPKIRPKDSVSKTLTLDCSKGEVINFVQVGNDEQGYVKYLQIITSEGKQFKWGNLDQCTRNQQKNIRKYENIILRGRLSQIMDRDAPNYYCLGGIAFTIIYLSPR